MQRLSVCVVITFRCTLSQKIQCNILALLRAQFSIQEIALGCRLFLYKTVDLGCYEILLCFKAIGRASVTGHR